MLANEPHVLGAVQIKDGLFIGDAYAAQDLEFIAANKVSHIINCAAKQIPNHWESIGIAYMTLKWVETDFQTLFDNQDILLNDIYRFIESAITKGESVLVHSLKGQNRSCCVLAAYLMKKYRWSLYKSLEYLNSRKSNLEIRTSFFHQLIKLESRLEKISQGLRTSNWNEIGDDPKNIESEELLLTNTFLNSQRIAADQKSESLSSTASSRGEDVRPNRVRFSDQTMAVDCSKEKKLYKAQQKGMNNNSCDSRPRTPRASLTVVKSILKGSGKVFDLKPQDSDAVASHQKLSGSQTLSHTNSEKDLDLKKIGHKANPVLSELTLDPNRASQGQANIRGNVIHITVNNYITNSNVMSNTNASTPRKKSEANSLTNIDDITQENVRSSPRNKRLLEEDPNSHRQKENSLERLEEVTSSDGTNDNKFFRSDGFALISNLNKRKSPRNIQNAHNFDRESTATKPVVRKFRFTVSNVSKKPSMIVYGNRTTPRSTEQLSDRKTESMISIVEDSKQSFEKDLNVKDIKNVGSQSYESETRGPSYYRAMNPGQRGPIKPKKDFRVKNLALADPNFNFVTEEQLFSTPRDKLTPRPLTAPEQPLLAGSKSSQHLSLAQSPNAQIRKGRAFANTQGLRQSSIQTSRESNLAIDSERERFRSSSPSQQKNLLFVPFRKS